MTSNIDRWKENPMPPVIVKPDTQIQQDVLAELRWDSRVEATDVGVEVEDGVVTLTGAVTTHAKRMAAQKAAHRVAGVLDVANDIEVRPPGTLPESDSDIAHKVREKLRWDAHVAHERIESTVSGGWLTLAGTVDQLSQREDAERALRRLSGVCGITNRITVSSHEADPDKVRRAIVEALERQVEQEARGVQIEVHDGTVRLTGRVHSWRKRRDIVDAVSHAPGVQFVDAQLRIDPYSA
jgi:osmotically-inducible protein OsmY